MTETWPALPGFLRAQNISVDPDLYEIENEAADPDCSIEAAMRRICPWDGKVLMDVGAGTGFHIERFHAEAAHVVAVEPDAELRPLLMRRIAERGLSRVSVIGASAESTPLRESSVDIAHARFSYFFGPGCEPGLAELERVMKQGGTAFYIDNDLRNGTFASWIRFAHNLTDSWIDETETFWTARGFTIERLDSRWRFQDRDAFERVMRLEFPIDAEEILGNHGGLEVDYKLLLIHKTIV